MVILDQKARRPITLYFICKGYGITNKTYCTEWEDSELAAKLIKPTTVEFVEDPHREGNWFEYDSSRPRLLPYWFLIEKAVQLRGYPYLQLEKAGQKWSR